MGYPRQSSDSVPILRVARPAADPSSLAARRFARRRPQPPQPMQHLSGADQLALARIAERFAPGAERSPLAAERVEPVAETLLASAPGAPLKAAEPTTEKPLPSKVRRPVAPKASEPPVERLLPSEVRRAAVLLAAMPGMRTLIAVLVVVALLPSLVFGAMLWLGAVKVPWSAGGADTKPSPAATLAAAAPAPDPIQSKRVAAMGPLALTAPDTLEATAGQETPFAIALDHTGNLPARSSIAVAGLPRGATLSVGRPYGETEWNLSPDEIGDLNLILPKTAAGQATLRTRLVAPDGEIVAGAETVLKVAAAPDAVAKPDTSDTLFEPGNALAPQIIYDQDLIGISAWDEQSRERLANTGVEERLTTPDAPATPPGEVLRVPAAAPAQVASDPLRTKWIEPSAYVNLRDGPTASASVISIVPKGTKLTVLGRKRGWIKVTNPSTSESGWVYAGNIVGSTRPRHGTKRESQPDTDDNSSGSSWLGSLLGSR